MRIITGTARGTKLVTLEGEATRPTIDKVKAYNDFGYNVLFVGDDWKNTERFITTEREFKEQNMPIETSFLPYTKEGSTSMIREKLK